MGLDTHGVIRLKVYMDRIIAGGNNIHPTIHAVRESACTALLDGDNCLGAVGGRAAVDLAMEKAESVGIGVVVIRNCNHYGPGGYWSRIPVRRDLIGVSLTNTMASMPPTGGAAPRQGNDVYSIGFPAGAEPPVVIDASASVTSWGTCYLALQSGAKLPAGAFMDSEGRPCTDAQTVYDSGMLVPFGAHKGLWPGSGGRAADRDAGRQHAGP